MQAIAARYLKRPSSSSKDWPARSRLKHVLGLAWDCHVGVAILIQEDFCGPHEADIPPLKVS